MSIQSPTLDVSPSPRDIGDLYSALSSRLEQIVRRDVGAPEPVVEDACQFAWDRLLCNRDHVRRDTALAWLATTAVREALKLLRREHRELSLDEVGPDDVSRPKHAAPGPEDLVLQRERLGLVGSLPTRQQRMVWLHALGLSYVEIALQTGCTARTVERQLLRATRAIRAAAGAETRAKRAGRSRTNPAPAVPPTAVRTTRSAPAV